MLASVLALVLVLAAAARAAGDSRVRAVGELLEWLQAEGMPRGVVDAVDVRVAAGGLGVFARRDLAQGQQLVGVPRACALSRESALASEIGFVFRQHKSWGDNEVFALHLVWERSLQARSRFAPMLALFPPTDGSVLRWPREALEELRGSNTLGMIDSFHGFVERTHAALVPHLAETYGEDLFPPSLLTRDAVRDALIWMWSRAIDFRADDGSVRRVIPALVDLFNHAPNATSGFKVATDDETATFRVHAPAVRKGDEIFLNYGDRPGFDFLLMYSFVVDEPFAADAVGVTIDISPDDPTYAWKWAALDDVVPDRSAFKLRPDDIDPLVLIALRTLLLKEGERGMLPAALRGESVSLANDMEALNTIEQACAAMLAKYPTSLADDERRLARMSPSERAAPRGLAVRLRVTEKRILHACPRHVAARRDRVFDDWI